MKRFQCERCGGTGQQEAGLWTGTAYASVAGLCDACNGEGLLGPMPFKCPSCRCQANCCCCKEGYCHCKDMAEMDARIDESMAF